VTSGDGSAGADARRERSIALAPEGLPIVLTALVAGVVLTALLFAPLTPPRFLRGFLPALLSAGPLLLLAGLFSAFFFRDPRRRGPDDPALVLSAADGRVTTVERGEEGLKISVFMSVFNVHVNRAPAAGLVKRVEYKPGEFLAAWKRLAERVNERVTVTLGTAWGPIAVTQIAGVLARRIVCRVRPGARLARGERFGLIRFGSCVVVLLPPGATPLVSPKDRVRAGVTPIARWSGDVGAPS